MGRVLGAMLLALVSAGADAHKASDGYLAVEHRGEAIEVTLELALRDLDGALDLDADGDGRLTWGEVRTAHPAIQRYVAERLTIRSGGEACSLAPRRHALDRHTDGTYAVLELAGTCEVAAPVLAIDYRLLFEVDATHRALLRYAGDGGATRSYVLRAEATAVNASAASAALAQAVAYLAEGVHHILQGYDHLLFLVSLLLPAVLVRSGRGWQAAPSFHAAFVDVAKVVTAFTLAHSVTLTLAVLDLVTLPPRLVESAIALSVVLAAIHNLRPVLPGGRAVAAFAFGLIHGFGFAGALGELGLPSDALALSLASFNVGVELGQLAVAAAFLPLAFAARGTRGYRIALTAGSIAIVAVGCAWLVERALDVPIATLLARG